MASMHRKAKTAYVFPDGDGGFVLKLLVPIAGGHDNEQIEFELTPQRAAGLLGPLARVVQHALPDEKAAS